MLKLTLLEFFLRGLPEDFLLTFAVYAFSKTVINAKKYIISSILLTLIVYLIRFLPIQIGVNTILNIFGLIFLTVNINKISIIKSIQACIMTIILEFICEGINMLVIQYIFKLNINSVFKEPTLKILYGIPSLLIFACFITLYYMKKLKKKELGDVFNGEII